MKTAYLNFLILAANFYFTISADAKRAAPQTVAPIIKDGIEYSVPLNRTGYVVATWTKTHREIWSRQIYVIKYEYKQGLEEDVQWVFINGLRFENDKLRITNEKGGQFELDPETLAVKVIKGEAVIDFTHFEPK
jgi:hypothetical protein